MNVPNYSTYKFAASGCLSCAFPREVQSVAEGGKGLHAFRTSWSQELCMLLPAHSPVLLAFTEPRLLGHEVSFERIVFNLLWLHWE